MFVFVVSIVICIAHTFCLECCVSAYIIIIDDVYLKFRNRVEFFSFRNIVLKVKRTKIMMKRKEERKGKEKEINK